MSDKLENTLLFDIYGVLLTEKQRETLDLYYNEDLTLSEISDASGITRQGVMGCIHKAQSRLDELENQLGLAQRFLSLYSCVSRLEKILDHESLSERESVDRCIDEIKQLL